VGFRRRTFDLPARSKVNRDSGAEDVRPSAAARRRGFAVIDGKVPLDFGIGIEEPVQAQDDVIQRRAIHALILKIEITVADADLPGAATVFRAPDVEVAPGDNTIEYGAAPIVSAILAGKEVK